VGALNRASIKPAPTKGNNMKINKKSMLIIIVVIAILFFVFSAWKEKKMAVKVEGVPVKVMKVELKDIDVALDYAGNIKGRDEALVYPKVGGKIIEMIKEDGSPVTKGDTILFIDRDEVGLEFEKAPVESPLTGLVGRIYVDLGTNVTPQTPVAMVVDMDKVKIDYDVPQKYLPMIFLDQEAKITVDAYPQDIFIGKVTKISPIVDLGTRTAPVEITIDNQGYRLRSGMFAKVSLVIEKHTAVPVILKEAVMGRDPDTYVFTVDAENIAHLNKVKLGIRQGAYYEVIDGVKENDLVAIMGQQKLRDKDPVEPQE
jgi:multidrug efflux pump subunit AcrA (membrane-fusion protein)